MNEKRRKRLREAVGHLERASEIVQDCKDEEQEAHDGLPEPIQWSERGEKMEEAVSAMEEAISLIDEATEKVNEVAY